VRVGFRGVKATSPLIELLADGVDPPTMICCAEILPIGHLRDRSELSRAEPMSWESHAGTRGKSYALGYVGRVKPMTLERTASICFGIVITAAIASGQQQSDRSGQRQQRLGASAIEPMYSAGDVAPLRRVHTRSESNGRTVVVETVQGPDLEGRLASFEEVVTETTRGPDATQTRQDVFRVTADGRRHLAESNESRQDTQPNGHTGTVHSTWVPDLNGRLRLTARLVEESRSSAPDVRRTDTSLFVPGMNEPLRETERTEYSSRRINPEVVRHDSTHLVRDVNGRWKPSEIRQGEVRETGTSECVEEETIQRTDLNGNLAIVEMSVIRSSRTKEQEQVVIETYAPITDVRGTNGRPPLRERVHRATTTSADGVRHTVEEVEARSRVSPNEPMRMIRRTVTTTSPTGTDQWVTERQVFELDVNGRLRLVRNE
jgi:hypothetical protein